MTAEDSPEYRKALEEACDSQYREWLYGGTGVTAETKSKIEGVMKEIQRKKTMARKKAEAMRRSLAWRASAVGMGIAVPKLPDEITQESMDRYREEITAYSDKIRAEAERQINPHYREITENLKRKHGLKGLVCPECGEGDQGNRMNGKPWCIKCNLPLMTVEKAESWVKPTKPRPKSYTFKDLDGVVKKK